MPTLKSARRPNAEYAINLVQRRTWYTDPPAGDPPTPPAPPAVPPAAPPEPKFTQAEMDAIAGRTRKEAADTATKKLLEQLGFDPNDAKAVETIKAQLAAAKKAEDDKKSAETLALEKVAALEKERDDAKAAREALETERRLEKRDNDLVVALTAKELNCQNPRKVMTLLKADHPTELAALLKDDGTVDATKLKALAELGKKENPEYFDTRRGAGTGSHGGGRDTDGVEAHELLKIASARNQQRIRG